jgi:hypothetical protein
MEDPAAMRTALIACVLTLVFTALPAGAAELQLTTIPSDAGRSDKQLWRGAMAEFYGAYDKKLKCWVSTSEGERYCMRPHTLHRVSAGEATHYYISIGGRPLGDDKECHACPGAMGLIVLTDATKTLGIVARSAPYLEIGSWGHVPPEENVAVHRIGQPANFAWTIADGWMGQGVQATWVDIHGVIGDQVQNIGKLTTGFSDEGNCDNGINMMTEEKCTDVSFEPVFQAEDGSTRFGTILLKGSGTWKGAPFAATYRAVFDEAAMSYRMPADFPPDFIP